MHYTFKILVGLSMGVILLSSNLHAQNYTLEECITIALKQSPDVKSSNKAFEAVESQIKEAKGSATPEISIKGKYELSEQYDVTVPSLDLATSQLLDPTNPAYDASNAALAGSVLQDMGTMASLSAPKKNSASISLAVTQILYAQGKVMTGLDIAKSYKKSLKAERKGIESNIRLDVTNAFNQAIYFKEAINIYLESISLAEKHVEQVSTLYDNGLVSELDFLKAKLQVEDLKSSKDKMMKDFELAKNSLLITMGLPYNPQVTLDGELKPVVEVPNTDNAIERAQSQRSEILQLERGIEMQNHLVKIEKSEYHPLVYMGGALSRIGMTDDFIPDSKEWFTDARVFLGLEWNLFKGMQTKQKVVQAKVDVEKLEIKKNHVEKLLKIQIEAEKNNLNEAFAREKIKQQMVELAQKVLNIANVSYENQTATQLEVLDANMSLRKAKLDLLQAVLDINTSRNNLLNAMGEF